MAIIDQEKPSGITPFPNLPVTLDHDDDRETIIRDCMDNDVCQVFEPDFTREETGAYITMAINMHHELVNLVQEFSEFQISAYSQKERTQQWLAMKKKARAILAKNARKSHDADRGI